MYTFSDSSRFVEDGGTDANVTVLKTFPPKRFSHDVRAVRLSCQCLCADSLDPQIGFLCGVTQSFLAQSPNVGNLIGDSEKDELDADKFGL